jgi:5-methylcytosine-specific restriction endonuclease McrA
MKRPNSFSKATQQLALARQNFMCASCGTKIVALGNAGRSVHEFGESARAHHVLHVKLGGLASVDNCAILCEACHYCVHEGGKYRFGTVAGCTDDYPHYRG